MYLTLLNSYNNNYWYCIAHYESLLQLIVEVRKGEYM